MSMDSQPASSSSAHFSSSKVIRFGAGGGGAGGADLGSVLRLDAADEVPPPAFFDVVVFAADAVGFALGSSFSHDSKLISRSGLEMSLLDRDC